MSIDLVRIQGGLMQERSRDHGAVPAFELAGCPDKIYAIPKSFCRPFGDLFQSLEITRHLRAGLQSAAPAGLDHIKSRLRRPDSRGRLSPHETFTRFFLDAPSNPVTESGRSTSASHSVARRTAESPR